MYRQLLHTSNFIMQWGSYLPVSVWLTFRLWASLETKTYQLSPLFIEAQYTCESGFLIWHYSFQEGQTALLVLAWTKTMEGSRIRTALLLLLCLASAYATGTNAKLVTLAQRDTSIASKWAWMPQWTMSFQCSDWKFRQFCSHNCTWGHILQKFGQEMVSE